MKRNQKVFRMITCAVFVCVFGMLFSNIAEAAKETSATWHARYVNASNAPAEANYVDHVTIWQKKSATATCSSASHSITTAYTGEARIACENYAMTQVVIQGLGTAQCLPAVGEPLQLIEVKYAISAYTPTTDDVYDCGGSIFKNP